MIETFSAGEILDLVIMFISCDERDAQFALRLSLAMDWQANCYGWEEREKSYLFYINFFFLSFIVSRTLF